MNRSGREAESSNPLHADGSDGLGVRAVVLVLGVALSVRALHLAGVGSAAWWGVHLGDAEGYVRWATRIAAGDWIGSEGFYQAPLYPYVLAVIETAFGRGIWPIAVVQSLGGAVIAVMVGTATAFLWGRRVGLIGGLLMATYAPAFYFDGIIQKASFAGLVTASVAVLVARRDTNVRNWPLFVLGALTALVCLLREHALVWLPLVLIFGWTRGHSGRTTIRCVRSALVVGGALLVFLPVGWRNAAVSGEWSFSTFQAGPNIYIGNHAGADGRYQPLVRGHETPAFERVDATRLAEQAEGRRLSPREVSSYWMGRAIRDVREDPMGWLGLMARKAALVFNRFEVSDVESQYVAAGFSPALKVLGRLWHFGVLFPLAVVGVVATRSQWRRLWPFYGLVLLQAAAVALTFVSARYRYPMVVMLMPFAAAGLVDLVAKARGKCAKVVVGRVLLVTVVAVACNVSVQDEDRLTSMSYMNLGVAMAKAGDLPVATSYFEQAVLQHAGSAEANNNLAQALAMQGAYEQAIVHYQRALREAPELAGVDYNLAVALERVGRRDDALAHYRRALERNPGDADAGAAIERLGGTAR